MNSFDNAGTRRENRHRAYRALRAARPHLFTNPPGAPIEIVFDRVEQDAIADTAALDYASRGIPCENADIGVVYEDPFICVVRDAVRFSSGRTGPYVRVLPASGTAGSAILPLTKDGEIVLISHFRHDSRRWHWEIPRGFGDAEESPDQTAERELQEELGLRVLSLVALGEVHFESGGSDSLFLGQVDGDPTVEVGEGISEVIFVGQEDVWAEIASGKITDAYTLTAIVKAAALGLLPGLNAEVVSREGPSEASHPHR